MSKDSKEPSSEEVKVEDESNAPEDSEVKMLLKQNLKVSENFNQNALSCRNNKDF